MTEKIIFIIDFLSQIETLLLNMIKLLKIPGFFSLNYLIQGFSMFPGKVATQIHHNYNSFTIVLKVLRQ